MAGGTAATARLLVLRLVTVVTVALGANYILWRWSSSLNWAAWPFSVALVLAETYSMIDVSFFGLTMWRARTRPAPTAPPRDLTVDVFITTYNEDVELVMATAAAAERITYPHRTWILDDGDRRAMKVAAEAIGIGYVTRSADWADRPRHAKAGNLNNALMKTEGEFLLILDADQVPDPDILDKTLGYFSDERVALVQTPQVFGNVGTGDPLGSQAPLFYGPIQQGKDGWNSAFFCGSNAVLRREALMMLGISRYVAETEHAIVTALNGSDRVLAKALRSAEADDPMVRLALSEVGSAIEQTRQALIDGMSIAEATFALRTRVDDVSRGMVDVDLHMLALDLEAIRQLPIADGHAPLSRIDVMQIEESAAHLASRELSPLGALESVQALLRAIDVDRAGEAQPLMPLATISVTEDMATSMRLHASGWKSVFHRETLAVGLAPEDLGTMLTQRLRWAQGTMQVMFRENPLLQKGMTVAQRLMYFSTMWSYLSGFAAIVYFAAPVIYLVLGVLPVSTTAGEFFLRFLPFMIANQLLFLVASRGLSTWRGQQYSLALFPIWIRSVTSAAANVFFGRPLGFAVTPKSRQDHADQWHLVVPQIVVGTVLIVASFVGLARLLLGLGEPIGTLVNLIWVIFDLAVISVIVPAVRYRGYDPKEETR